MAEGPRLARDAHAQQGVRRDGSTSLSARDRAALFGAGLAGVGLGVATSTTLALIFAGGCFEEDDGDCKSVQGIVRGMIGGVTMTVTVPFGVAGATAWVGKRRGYDGRWGYGLLGSAAGLTLGTGAGLALGALASDETFQEPRPIGALFACGLLEAAAGGALGYRWSAERRLTVAPSVAPTAGGVTFGVAGRF